MAQLELKNVYKKYPNGFEAAKDINFIGERGEFIVLVGPSGCGKSTVLRMIAGLEDITSGELMFNGEVVNDQLPRQRDVGMVFQNYALYPHMTVFENIAFPLKIKKEKKDYIKKRVNEVAEVLDLSKFINSKPKQLSGGQRQRVALGRAIIRNPKIFLFDEPLSNLDAKLRVQMRTEIMRLHREINATSVYVTHDQVEAMTMGTKLIVLNEGVIQQIAPPSEIYDEPANLFVAGFIGSPQINCFKGKLSTNGKQVFYENNTENKFEIPGGAGKQGTGDFDEIIIAVRPEYLSINDREDENGFKGEIINIEHLGHELIIYFSTNDNLKCSRIEIKAPVLKNISLEVGKILNFVPDKNKILFFNKEGTKIS